MDDWLSDFSRALDRATADKEETRKAFNKKLEEVGPVLFIPTTDAPEDHGIGWFRVEGGFIAYQRYSDGYQVHRYNSLEDSVLRELVKHMPKEES